MLHYRSIPFGLLNLIPYLSLARRYNRVALSPEHHRQGGHPIICLYRARLHWEGVVHLQFEDAYDVFIKYHVKARRGGPGADRLKDGLDHAEKMFVQNVWWSAFHRFDGLHPEYEVHDYTDGYRYIDFAYLQPRYRIAIEIDGIGSHWTNITQWKFSDHCQRQNHLVIDGWHVLRFTYNDIQERPRLCQQTIQQLIGRLTGESSGVLRNLNVTDREIVRLALGSNRPISARDLVTHVHMGRNTATRHLKALMDTGWLEPATGSIRIRSYRIHPAHTNVLL